MGAFGAIRSLLEGGRGEYRGWRKFHRATGVWPIWSILAAVTSIPVLFAFGVYVFIRTLETQRLPLICTALVLLGFGLGLAWYALRRWANYADVLRARKIASRVISPAAGRFIR